MSGALLGVGVHLSISPKLLSSESIGLIIPAPKWDEDELP